MIARSFSVDGLACPVDSSTAGNTAAVPFLATQLSAADPLFKWLRRSYLVPFILRVLNLKGYTKYTNVGKRGMHGDVAILAILA